MVGAGHRDGRVQRITSLVGTTASDYVGTGRGQHGGGVRVVVEAFKPSPEPIGYWEMGVSVDDSRTLFLGHVSVGQVIAGTGSRVRMFSQFAVDDYRIEYHC